jgi:hypothetical protein
MKTLITLALLLCLSSWTWGQGLNAGYAVPPNMNGHPQTATTQTLPNGGGYTVDSGTRPASDISQTKPEVSLGEVARENRRAHTTVKKADKCYSNM